MKLKIELELPDNLNITRPIAMALMESEPSISDPTGQIGARMTIQCGGEARVLVLPNNAVKISLDRYTGPQPNPEHSVKNIFLDNASWNYQNPDDNKAVNALLGRSWDLFHAISHLEERLNSLIGGQLKKE